MQESTESMGVPGLHLMGTEDSQPTDIREHFERARANDAPRAWVWLRGQGHWPEGMGFNRNTTTTAQWRAWAATDVAIPWTEAMIGLRMPNDADPPQGSGHASQSCAAEWMAGRCRQREERAV